MYNITIFYIKRGFCLPLESLSSRKTTSQ